MRPIALAADPAVASRLANPLGSATDLPGGGTFDDVIARLGADGQGTEDEARSGGAALKPSALKYPVLQGLPALADADARPATGASNASVVPSLDLAPLLAKAADGGDAGPAGRPSVQRDGEEGGGDPDASAPGGPPAAGGVVATVLSSPPGIVPGPVPSAVPGPPSVLPAIGASAVTAAASPSEGDASDAAEVAPMLVSAIAVANHPAPVAPPPAFLASTVAPPAASSVDGPASGDGRPDEGQAPVAKPLPDGDAPYPSVRVTRVAAGAGTSPAAAIASASLVAAGPVGPRPAGPTLVGPTLVGPTPAGPTPAGPTLVGAASRIATPAPKPSAASAPGTSDASRAAEPSTPVTGTSEAADATDPGSRSDVAAGPTKVVADASRAEAASSPILIDASTGSVALIRGVADAIAKAAAPAIAATGSGTPAIAPAEDPADLPAALPTRTLTLQLNPGSLGTVSVRLHLAAGALDVRIAVSNPQTLGLISRERDTLVAALHDQSTTIHSLTIGGGDGPPPGGHDAPSQRAAGDQASGNRSFGGSGTGQSGRQGSRPTPDRQAAERPGALAAAAPDAGGALFV